LPGEGANLDEPKEKEGKCRGVNSNYQTRKVRRSKRSSTVRIKGIMGFVSTEKQGLILECIHHRNFFLERAKNSCRNRGNKEEGSREIIGGWVHDVEEGGTGKLRSPAHSSKRVNKDYQRL